ncbi:DEAD/DEAH box helicase family protein [Silvibacterium acidisoli]|uniref:DEAD/DEAH box helicase family protein n=1 Tax=Acidobacteriaceae bacterium ZG23-2 TaxID=2883246 RepID=UPI00406CBF87
MSTNFGFLQVEWPQIYESAVKAESFVYPDPATACIHARRTLELVMHWLFKADSRMRLPYQTNLSAMVHEETFVNVAGQDLQAKARLIIQHGNNAAHAGNRPVTKEHALAAVRELFHLSFWMARTYARGAKPVDTIHFLPMLLPTTSPIPPATKAKLQELETSLSEKDAKLAELLTGQAAMDAELQQLRAEIAEARKRNEAAPDTHDYNEQETRDAFLDLLLAEAGWELKHKQDREYKVTGMPSNSGIGYVDYVLWGKDGKPLGLVEAKRTRKSPHTGQQQAKLYADCLEAQFGQRPVIFYTNGYDHWMWDDLQHPPRPVSGFYTHDELELLIQRRQTRKPLAVEEIDAEIVERYYQTRAIRKVAERFETDRQRKALLVMATGAGKTRTVIALCDLLMKAGWAKRVLFLADRVALVKQATNAFKAFLPSSSPVNLVTEKSESGRVYISTYPTMMGLIDEKRENGTRRFGTGHFDLVIVDEAHRSIYQKYAAIFDYFDSYLVGLTATPKDEVDRNTYRLFALEDGVPTDEYSLDDAIKDKFLVPPKAVSVPLKFQREGIKYNELTEEQKDHWDALEWDDEEGEVPDEVSAADVNNWLFNKDTVDKVLAHLMTHGDKVAGGDRLGKTIIFAKNHRHAEFIVQRFDENYPHYAGHFARLIDFSIPYAQSLIDSFSHSEKNPHIAVSVDMLDTGIDVPEVVNLVFFKLVRSKTKFWQMVGRGTRLCPELMGPGRDKKRFLIFDFCQNLEFFSENPETTEGSTADSLSKRLFVSRLELIAAMAFRFIHDTPEAVEAEHALRKDLAERLHREVAAMTIENFLVRPHRRLVEQFTQPEAWEALSEEDRNALASHVAGLPSALPAERPEAKQFDLMLLQMQLKLLRGEAGFTKLQEKVQEIARLLETQTAIPAVAAKLPMLQEIQTAAFWEGATVVTLETVRKGLRDLVQFIERRKRAHVITDIEDHIGEGSIIDLPGTSIGVDIEKLREKARVFLKKHEDDAALHKLRFNEPLTPDDLSALEAIFLSEGTTREEIDVAAEEAEGLGLFVRSLVGMDREAAKSALARFIQDRHMTANQIEFIDMVINHLAARGWIELAKLYESPFTDIHPHGPDGLFPGDSTLALVSALALVRQNAAATS